MVDSFSEILKKTATSEAVDWLTNEIAFQRSEFNQRTFYFAFSGVSRRFDKKAVIDVSDAEQEALDQALPGFTVVNWDEFRLARVILLLVLAEQPEPVYRETLETLLGSADLREQVAIYSAFPLLPDPDFLVPLAREGLRTNIIDVFDAIALENPFPAKHFETEAWNQMVLKALFIERPLYRIEGIDERANLTLTEALSNLAHERWAAGRWVSPELWRCCANFLTDQIIEDLVHVVSTDEPGELDAIALISANDTEGLLDPIRDDVRTLLDDVADGRLTWDSLGKELDAAP